MPPTGILRTWHDDRGFGFIAPTHGGAEVFVHISAFQRDGSRPTQGEQLRYELGRGKNGEPQAVKVMRLAVGPTSPRQQDKPAKRRSRLPVSAGIAALVVVALLAHTKLRAPVPATAPLPAATPPEAVEPASTFRCDGRRHCSQMTSCAEATYFLKNCPGAEMDGNHDGVPCEQQWCTSPLSR
ncbi:cold shock domain-containing protein [Roseateles sp. P5_E7]